MWTVIEYNLGIIAASMPALRRPLAAIFPILLGRGTTSSAAHLNENGATHPRAPSTISSASTKTSFSRPGQGSQAQMEMYHEKDERYRSGLRTELFDLEGSDFDLEECERVRNGRADGLQYQDWPSNNIMKTTEVKVEPGSNRNSTSQYKLFPG